MEFIKAMLLILVAEMGDKTQIVAMAFAARYKLHQILIGVALGSAANHGLAILFGTFLTQYLDMKIIHSAAGLLFLIFAFLSLDIEDPEDEDEAKEKFGPLLTVALAFFIGELGDKTQLTALSLSTDAVNPLLILMGTTTGMVLTSLLGILIAQKFGERIPEEIMKVMASAAFLIFGSQKMLMAANLFGVSTNAVLLTAGAVVLIMAFRLRQFHASVQTVRETRLKQKAAALYRTINIVRSGLESMCKGEEHCGKCQGHDCLIGYMKLILSKLEKDEDVPESMVRVVKNLIHRDVSSKTLYRTLRAIISYYSSHPEEFVQNSALTQIRLALEELLAVRVPSDIKQFKAYKKWIDENISEPADTAQLQI